MRCQQRRPGDVAAAGDDQDAALAVLVAADHPRLDLLRHRTLYAVQLWEPDDALHDRRCLDRVRRAWEQLRELNQWCADHVGVTEKTRR